MKYSTLTLILTYNCNLACDYCFCGRKRKENMSEEIAKKAIDYFAKRSRQKANIVFFGGEPLLQSNLIRELCRYCDEIYIDRFIYCITTNGTLLNKSNIELIEKYNMAVTISIDGKKESHDLHRNFHDGSPSWELIMNNVNLNSMNKDNITLRLTFTKQNISKLADNVITLHEMGFKKLAFYPASDKDDMYTEADIKIFNDQIDLLIEYNYECYLRNKPISIHWFNRSIRSHINSSGGNCLAGVGQFSVTPDGEVYPCNRVDFNDKSLCIGNLDNGINKKKQENLRKDIIKKDPECDNCDLKQRCNVCQMDAYQNSGTLWEVPWYYCLMNQYVIMKADNMAERLYKEKNEIFLKVFYNDTLA